MSEQFSEEYPKGGLAAELVPSPARKGNRDSETDSWEAGFDWFSFVCVGCGEHTFIGRDRSQPVEDFALMCEWLFGFPPLCSSCSRE